MGYSQRKFENEYYLRQNRINTNYPVKFNRINWDMVEENIDELCDFQRKHDDILPPILFYATGLWEKIYSVLCEDHEKEMKAIQLKHSNKHISYDSVYEFIQKYPEWDKLVFYDENLENLCDELLTIHINTNIPLEFNRINWQKVDQKIDKIYEILLNQEKKTVPSILFINSQDIRGVLSEHYEIITTKMWEYYINKRLEKENPTFNEYNNNQKYNTYDGFYHFIKDYPELSDIVFFDPDK